MMRQSVDSDQQSGSVLSWADIDLAEAITYVVPDNLVDAYREAFGPSAKVIPISSSTYLDTSYGA